MREHWSSETSSEYLLTKVASTFQSSSSDESVSVLGNRNMNAISKHGASLRKPVSGFRFLLSPDFLCLANKINYDPGRGPLTVGGPGSLNLLNPLLLRHCVQLKESYENLSIFVLTLLNK